MQNKLRVPRGLTQPGSGITAYLTTHLSSELDLLSSLPSPSPALLYHLPVTTVNQIPS